MSEYENAKRAYDRLFALDGMLPDLMEEIAANFGDNHPLTRCAKEFMELYLNEVTNLEDEVLRLGMEDEEEIVDHEIEREIDRRRGK